MTEINLLDFDIGAITAPAGCGKTEIVITAILQADVARPILILTHTNAGVAALRYRLEQKGANRAAYKISTIDGWLVRLVATFPSRSEVKEEALKLSNPRIHYPEIRQAGLKILSEGHIDLIIQASYSRLIVDEYQDCNLDQHAVVSMLARLVPCCVLGDPLQAIFDFSGPIVDWESNVLETFGNRGTLSTPWRWNNVSENEFGRWLLEVRDRIIAKDTINLSKAPKNVEWVDISGADRFQKQLKAAALRSKDELDRVLIIGDSRRPDEHQQFASRIPGGTTIENAELTTLTRFANTLDLDNSSCLKAVVEFAESVMTNVGAQDFLRRIGTIRLKRHRSPPTEIELEAMRFAEAPSYSGAADFLSSLSAMSGVRSYRPHVLRPCIHALKIAAQGEVSFQQAALSIREQGRVLGRSVGRRSVGSTLLLKGLEAEHCVILDSDGMNGRNLYVAMTRGSKSLTICSPRSTLDT